MWGRDSDINNMGYKYLPPNKDNKLYSPIGVNQLFKKSVEDEGGNIQIIFDKKNKYKQLIELWYASFFAVAVYKWTGNKFLMYPSDNPDIHFVKTNEKGKKQEGFSVEIMTLFMYGQKNFNEDYKTLAHGVWENKGKNDYDQSELLLVSRLDGKFDINKFLNEINKFQWNFIRIWLGLYDAKNKLWTFFEISPHSKHDKIGEITIGLSEMTY